MHLELATRLGLDDMDRAGNARVVSVDDAQGVDRSLDVGNRGADEALLDGARHTVLVTWGDVPRGGDDLLIVRDRVAGEGLGVIESATRSLPEALAQARVTDTLGEPGVALDGASLDEAEELDELAAPVDHVASDQRKPRWGGRPGGQARS